jgi:N-methylhydantoinase A
MLAVDVGGTFISTVSMDDEGNADLLKWPTDFRDLTAGIAESVDRLELDLGDAERIVHSSVVILNSLLRRNVAKTGLITTQGFRDTLEIMRTNRPEELIFDIQQSKPVPLIPRRLRFEVSERLDFRGRVVRALDEEIAGQCISALREHGVEAVALCLLHSYSNDAHEQKLREMITREIPATSISVSSELAPQWREFERTSTTVQNASTMPIMRDYVSSLEDTVSDYGFEGQIFIMQSNGGMATASSVRTKPISTVFSSPAAGVVGASHVAKKLDLDKAITYDHGGSRCFMSVLEDGIPAVKEGGSLERWPILLDVVDIETIEAGANSRVWVDPRHVLRIGPEDVGTDPGPPCLGKGGKTPSVTDACLLLGHINPEYFMGGQLRLDVAASKEALNAKIARFYNMQVERVALGVQDLLVSIHAKGMREVSTKKGYDPRDLTLLAFGGAGGLYASMLAREVGMDKVVVPFAPSHMSCLGLMAANVRHDYKQMYVSPLKDVQATGISRSFNDLEAKAVDRLRVDGFPRQSIDIMRSAEVRYMGQEYTVDVPVPRRALADEDLVTMNDEFSELHERFYGYSTPGAPTEVIALQVTALGYLAAPAVRRAEGLESGGSNDPEGALKGCRSVFFRDAGEVTDCPTYERLRLGPGNVVKGPALVEEPYSTILLMPGDVMDIDKNMNAVISIGG